MRSFMWLALMGLVLLFSCGRRPTLVADAPDAAVDAGVIANEDTDAGVETETDAGNALDAGPTEEPIDAGPMRPRRDGGVRGPIPDAGPLPANFELVTDFDTTAAGSTPSDFVLLGQQLVFVANDGFHGRELWTTDLTTGRTELLVDLLPGALGSFPTQLTTVGSRVVFSAVDVNAVTSLYVTDGTAAGTVLLNAANPLSLFALNGKALFTVGVTAGALWVTDGTVAGTMPLGVPASRLQRYNGRAYFTLSPNELWSTDGTVAGTVQVMKNVVASPQIHVVRGGFVTSGSPVMSTFSVDGGFAPVRTPDGGTLKVSLTLFEEDSPGYVFTTFDSNVTRHVDATSEGLYEVAPFAITSIEDQALVGATAYFAMNRLLPDGGRDDVLTRSIDGGVLDVLASFKSITNIEASEEGVLISHDNEVSWWSPSGLTFLFESPRPPFVTLVAGHQGWFTGDDIVGNEPWVTDGTFDGTMRLADINALSAGSSGRANGVFGDRALLGVFVKNEASVWVLEGDGGMRNLVSPIPNDSILLAQTCSSHRGLFSLSGAAHERSIVFFDADAVSPATAVSTLVPLRPQQINLGTCTSDEIYWTFENKALRLTSVGGTTIQGGPFYAPINLTDAGLTYIFDNTFALHSWNGVNDIEALSGPGWVFSAVSNRELFAARESTDGGYELWTSDGTAATATFVATFPEKPRLARRTASWLAVVTATPLSHTLWNVSPTTQTSLHDCAGSTTSCFGFDRDVSVVGDRLFFISNTGGQGEELWSTDGTPSGTLLLKDICPGSCSGRPSSYAVLGNALYFNASDAPAPFFNTELWASDGTANGTLKVGELGPGPSTGEVTALFPFQGAVYFWGYHPSTGRELFRYRP